MTDKNLTDNLALLLKSPSGHTQIERLLLEMAAKGRLGLIAPELEEPKTHRLGDICDLYQPKTISISELVPNGEYSVYGANGIIGKYDKYNHEKSEVLVTCRGATCGKVNVSEPYAWINGNAMVVRPKYESLRKDYLTLVLRSVDYTGVITGTAQPQITKAPLSNISIRVPSLDAQQKIVQKTTEIMNVLLKIKKCQLRRNELSDAARMSAMDAISTAQSPKELQAACNRVQRHWEVIAGTPESVESLRMLILDMAIRGNMHSRAIGVDQVHECDPTSPFPIPKGWSWLRLDQISDDLGQENPKSDFHYIDVSSIDSKSGIISDRVKVVKAKDAPSRARKKIKTGSVIFSTVRPYLRNIAIVERDFSPSAIASTAFAVLDPTSLVLGEYLFLCLRSTYFKRFVESKQKGIAYPAINAGDLHKALIPVPSLEEQEVIVNKVFDFFALCDLLEAKTVEVAKIAEKFARSVVAGSA